MKLLGAISFNFRIYPFVSSVCCCNDGHCYFQYYMNNVHNPNQREPTPSSLAKTVFVKFSAPHLYLNPGCGPFFCNLICMHICIYIYITYVYNCTHTHIYIIWFVDTNMYRYDLHCLLSSSPFINIRIRIRCLEEVVHRLVGASAIPQRKRMRLSCFP